MNLNDMRNSAYNNMKGSGKPAEKNVSKPVFPHVSSKKQESQKNEPVSEKPVFEKSVSEKPLFKNVDREIGKILETQTTDYLKSGGLIKVPVAEKEKDGSDSVYRRVAKF